MAARVVWAFQPMLGSPQVLRHHVHCRAVAGDGALGGRDEGSGGVRAGREAIVNVKLVRQKDRVVQPEVDGVRVPDGAHGVPRVVLRQPLQARPVDDAGDVGLLGVLADASGVRRWLVCHWRLPEGRGVWRQWDSALLALHPGSQVE